MDYKIILFLIGIIIIIYLFICNFLTLPLSSGSKLQNFSFGDAQNSVHKLVAVMVEPRIENTVETIQRYMNILPEYTHFQIFHGNLNHTLLQNSFSNEIANNKISLHHLNVDNLDILNYNHICTSIPFWESISSENILVFQTDSTPCSKSTSQIEDFYEYDYIGAPMDNTLNNFIHFYLLGKGIYCNFKNYMNGGLSFRKKSKMIQVLKQYPWDEKVPEDVWFCMALYQTNGKLPSKQIARTFSFESDKLENAKIPWGLHKPRKDFKTLSSICPEIKYIPIAKRHSDYRNFFLL